MSLACWRRHGRRSRHDMQYHGHAKNSRNFEDVKFGDIAIEVAPQLPIDSHFLGSPAIIFPSTVRLSTTDWYKFLVSSFIYPLILYKIVMKAFLEFRSLLRPDIIGFHGLPGRSRTDLLEPPMNYNFSWEHRPGRQGKTILMYLATLGLVSRTLLPTTPSMSP